MNDSDCKIQPYKGEKELSIRFAIVYIGDIITHWWRVHAEISDVRGQYWFFSLFWS